MHTSVIVELGPLHEAVIARDGQPTVTQGMWLGFTFDHRIVDGMERATFQNAFCDAMEQAQAHSGLADTAD